MVNHGSHAEFRRSDRMSVELAVLLKLLKELTQVIVFVIDGLERHFGFEGLAFGTRGIEARGFSAN